MDAEERTRPQGSRMPSNQPRTATNTPSRQGPHHSPKPQKARISSPFRQPQVRPHMRQRMEHDWTNAWATTRTYHRPPKPSLHGYYTPLANHPHGSNPLIHDNVPLNIGTPHPQPAQNYPSDNDAPHPDTHYPYLPTLKPPYHCTTCGQGFPPKEAQSNLPRRLQAPLARPPLALHHNADMLRAQYQSLHTRPPRQTIWACTMMHAQYHTLTHAHKPFIHTLTPLHAPSYTHLPTTNDNARDPYTFHAIRRHGSLPNPRPKTHTLAHAADTRRPRIIREPPSRLTPTRGVARRQG